MMREWIEDHRYIKFKEVPLFVTWGIWRYRNLVFFENKIYIFWLVVQGMVYAILEFHKYPIQKSIKLKVALVFDLNLDWGILYGAIRG